MGREFLDYYGDNLAFIRKLSTEFASEFPKIASRLDISNLECIDPFVERLLEGTAFLCAKVEQKLDAGYPELLNGILQALAPNLLAPVPSCGVLQAINFELANVKSSAKVITGQSLFTANTNKSVHDVVFTPVFNTVLTPVKVVQAQFVSHDPKILELTRAKSCYALKLDLACLSGSNFAQLEAKFWDFYLNLTEQDASTLAELLCSNLENAYLECNNQYIKLDNVDLDLSILMSEQPLWAHSELGGVQRLVSYMTCPNFFKFIRVTGIFNKLKNCATSKVSLIFAFNKVHDGLKISLDSDSIMLNCVPVVNVFKRRSNRISVNDKYKLNINIDNTAPLDYEIYTIDSLEFFNSNNQEIFTAYPFFTTHASFKGNAVYQNFFNISRAKRQSGLNGNKRSSYNKSEVYVTLSGHDYEQNITSTMQFSANCYCTNADLPLFVPRDKVLSANIKGFTKFQIVASFTKPQAPYIDHGQQNEFKKLSYLLTNLASIFTCTDDELLFYLKEIVRAFALKSVDETSSLVESLVSAIKEPQTYRFVHKGCVFFEQGYKVTLILNSKKLEGLGVFVFAKTIVDVMKSMAPLNMPLSFEVYTQEQERVLVCKI